MWRRKKPDTADIQAQILDAQHSQANAMEALQAEKRRQPRIESLVSYLQERREQNGFGEDFTISQIPRI
jgi:hypothetical protein